MALVYLDGKYINASHAVVGVDNRSFRYGDGFFETIKCINGQLPLWDFHSQRLFATLEALHFEKPSFFTSDYIKEAILTLVKKNQVSKLARVRITIFRGDGGIYDTINHRPNLLIQTWILNPENNKLNENGLVVGDFKGGFKAADSFANLKSNNYLLYAMAALHAKRSHWNDALILNHKGSYADATIANLWVIKDGHICTPPLTDGPVAGVMRQYLFENLTKAGFKVSQRSVTHADLMDADEIFLTNAIYGIKWVGSCNEHAFTLNQTIKIYTEVIAPLWKAATI